MWVTDQDTVAKHGAYRVCIAAKRARQRAAVNRMAESFLDDRVLVIDERYNRGIMVFCPSKRQANLLANHFNGEISYLLKLRYTEYDECQRKKLAIREILEAQGWKGDFHRLYNFEVENSKTELSPGASLFGGWSRDKTVHLYVPCRRTAILAKLSLPDLMTV